MCVLQSMCLVPTDSSGHISKFGVGAIEAGFYIGTRIQVHMMLRAAAAVYHKFYGRF